MKGKPHHLRSSILFLQTLLLVFVFFLPPAPSSSCCNIYLSEEAISRRDSCSGEDLLWKWLFTATSINPGQTSSSRIISLLGTTCLSHPFWKPSFARWFFGTTFFFFFFTISFSVFLLERSLITHFHIFPFNTKCKALVLAS